MTTQYTPILKLALPVTGELSGTWGDVVNDNITSMVEQAIAGLATISTWTGNSKTLTTANGTTSESRCAMLVAQNGTGLSAAGEIICPASSKLYVLKNDTSYAITLKTAAGTGVAVASGNTAFLFCDGTNVNACVTTIVDGRVTGNLTVDGNATINGNTTLGNATTDTITATARFNTDLLPSTDNARDLGSTANSWKDLYIDGTAYLALVDINGGTIDGVSIGATTPATIVNVDNLSLNGNTISSTDTNGNVVIAPNGTGDVQLDADTVRVGDSGAAVTLTSNGAGALTVTTGGAADLTLSTNSGTTSGTIVIANGANGNITLTPDGTGDVILSADRVQIGDANTDTTLTTNGTGSLNLTTNNGTNSGTIQIAQGANGNITLTPNGTGSVSVPKLVWSNGTSGRVPYLTTGGQFTDSANMTFDGTTLTVAGLNNTGNTTLGNASGDTVTVTGTITSNLIFTDNTYDIGASGATRPRNLYLAGDATIGGSIAATTLDLTNLEVTNIKAKDGTASITLADSTGVASFTANPVLSGGTANGVAYLNGSKVLTTGSALTYNGTSLGLSYTADARGGVVLTTTNNTGVNEQGGFQVTNGNGTGVFAGVNGASFTTGGIGSANNAVLYSIGNTDLVFGRNTTEVMRLASTGVTITNSTVRLSNGYDINWGAGSTYLAGNSSSNVIQFVTNSAEIGRFTSAGMGVGTTDTSNGRINVVAGTGATGNSLFLTNVDGTYNPYVQFQHNGINGVTLLSSSSYGGTASNFTISIAGTPTATFNGNGNTGLRCVPSAWSGNTVLELFNPASAIRGDVYQGAVGGNNVTGLSHNAYWDGSNWKTIYTAATYYASRYEQTSGEHAWYTAGLTNGTISFSKSMMLTPNGRLGIGNTNPQYTLDVASSARIAGAAATFYMDSTYSTGQSYRWIVPDNTYGAPFGSLALYSDTQGAYRLVMTSAGNLGIGITAPTARLHVYQDSSSTSVMSGAYIQNVSSTTNSQAGIGFFAYDNFNAKIYTTRTGSSEGNIIFATNSGGGITEGFVGERARITHEGRFLINTSSTFNGSSYLQVNGGPYPIWSQGSDTGYTQGAVVCASGTDSSPAGRGVGVYMWNQGTTATWYMGGAYASADNWFVMRKTGSGFSPDAADVALGWKMLLTPSGVAYQGNNSTTWSTTSDARVKDDVKTIENGLDVVLALRPVDFYNKVTKKREENFIAQEYEQVLAKHVTREKPIGAEQEFVTDEILRLNPNLVPYLVSAIQKLSAEIEALKATRN